jgi:zinc finger protein
MTDISGNSYIENLLAPEKDPEMQTIYFDRSHEEDRLLGIFSAESDVKEEDKEKEDLKNEVLQFPTNCPNCGAPAFTNMKVTRESTPVIPVL